MVTMIVPLAANLPSTSWQTEILAPGICAEAVPRILAHALPQSIYVGMHVGTAGVVGVERQFAPGSGVALLDEGTGLAAWQKAQIVQAVNPQMRESLLLAANRERRRSSDGRRH